MSRVLPGLAEALEAEGIGLYTDIPALVTPPDDLDVDQEPVADVCDECGGSGMDCTDDLCGDCPTCGGLGYLL